MVTVHFIRRLSMIQPKRTVAKGRVHPYLTDKRLAGSQFSFDCSWRIEGAAYTGNRAANGSKIENIAHDDVERIDQRAAKQSLQLKVERPEGIGVAASGLKKGQGGHGDCSATQADESLQPAGLLAGAGGGFG